MTVMVTRENVGPRLVRNAGVLIGEGVEFRANCGCLCIFGIRIDNQEKTLEYGPCETHLPHSHEFLTRFAGEDAPKIPTDAWMAICLEELA